MTKQALSSEKPIDDGIIHAFVDGVCDEESKLRIMAAMAVDDELEAKIHAYRRQNNCLMLAKRSIQTVLSGAQQELIHEINRQRVKRQRFNVNGLRAAAAVAVMVSVSGGFLASLKDEQRNYWLEAIGFEQNFAAEPRLRYNFGADYFMSAASGGVQEEEISFGWWEGNQLASMLELPNLESIGMRLVNGSVINPSEWPAVRLYYRNASGQDINLFVGKSATSRDEAFTVLPEGQISLHWRDGDLVFALVGSAGSKNLLVNILELVSEAVIKSQIDNDKQASINTPQSNGQVDQMVLPQLLDNNIPKIKSTSDAKPATDNVIEQAPATPPKASAPKPL